MSEKTLNNIRIVHKHDTEENWLKATNFIPKQGELIIYDIDENHNKERFKIGDGKTNVNLLPFGTEDQLNKNLGIENANKVLTTDSNGNITTIGDAVNYFIIHATKNGSYDFPEDLSTSVVPKEDNADYYYITADKTYFEIVTAINNGLTPIMILDLGGILKLTLNYTGYDSLSDFISFTGNLTSWLDYPEQKAFQHQRQITAYICPHEDTGSQYKINDDYIRIYSKSFYELYEKINNINFNEDSDDFFYVNCTTVAAAADFTEGDIVYLPITVDKTFAEIKAATKAGKTPVANWSWLTENGIMLAAYLLNSYDTDIDDDFIYFNTVDVDSSGTILKTKIIICNPDPNFIHEITEDSVELSIIEIKSSQPDWNQNDSEATDYIKNRTHYMDEGACYYSCNSYSEYAANAAISVESIPMFVKVSDSMLTEEQLMEVKTSITLNNTSEENTGPITFEGTEKTIKVNNDMIMAMYVPYIEEGSEEDGEMSSLATTILISAKAGSILSDSEDGASIIIPEDGTYALNFFLMFIGSLSIQNPDIMTTINMLFNNWTVQYGNIKQLNQGFIPSSIARSANVLTKAEGMTYLEELHSDLLSVINTKITTPLTGLVGQVLAVKTVDENGKPTAFETIDGANSNNFFYVNCVSKVADFDNIIEDNVHFDITIDKTFSEIKAAVNEGKVPIAIFKWLNENNNDSVIDMLVFTDYGTDLDGDFIYFSSPTIDSAGMGKYLITICNPNPTYVHEITKDQISYKEVKTNIDDVDTLEFITVADIDTICGGEITTTDLIRAEEEVF